MDSGLALGVDMGGTHVAAALVNAAEGLLLPHTHCRSGLNSKGNANEIIETCSAVIKQAWALAGINHSPVGIAMPGPFDYEKGICLIDKQEKFQALFGMNFKNLLALQLGIKPADVKFINDASAFLKGEIIAGGLKGMNEAIGITLGTGLGSAYYKSNQVTDAELWLMPFQSGIAEDYISTRWFVNEYMLRYNKKINGVKELTEADNNEAAAIFGTFAANLAKFIELTAEKFNCSNVVIGGNIARAASFFKEHTQLLLNKSKYPAVLSIATLGENAAIIGAADLFEQKKKR